MSHLVLLHNRQRIAATVPHSIGLSLSPPDVHIPRGYTRTTLLTVTRIGGYTGPLTPSLVGLPALTTASFSPTTLTGSATTVMVSVSAGSLTVLGTTSVAVHVSGSGITDATTSLSVEILPTGVYEFLRPLYTLPQATAWGPGMTFNADTGLVERTAVDTTWPTPTTTVAITDTGNPATNVEHINSAIATWAAAPTGNIRITIPAGTLLCADGGILLKTNPSSYKCELVTVSWASLPALSPGTERGTYLNRVADSDKVYMPEIYIYATNNSVFNCEAAARGYYIRGFYFSNRLDYFSTIVFNMGSPTDDETVSARFPEDIHVAQCVVNSHGATNQCTRFIAANGRGLSCTDSYITHTGAFGADSQVMTFRYGQGPFKFANNWACLSGPGEAAFAGGSSLPGTTGELLPCDVEISGNYLTADGAGPKNFGEIKFGYRFLWDGNRTAWASATFHDDQFGVKLSDQYARNPYADTADVVLTNNWTPAGSSFVQISGAELAAGGNDQALQPRRISVINNLGIVTAGNASAIKLAATCTHHQQVEWNTLVGRRGATYRGALALASGDPGQQDPHDTVVRYNVMTGSDELPLYTYVCLAGTHNAQYGQNAFDLVYPDAGTTSLYEDNLTTGYGGAYSRQIAVGDRASIGFVNDGTDWSLSPSSPGYHAGPQGQNYGYQKEIFDIVQARVVAP